MQGSHLSSAAERIRLAMAPDPAEWFFTGQVVDNGEYGSAVCTCGHPVRRLRRRWKAVPIGRHCIRESVPFLIAAGAEGLARELEQAAQRVERDQNAADRVAAARRELPELRRDFKLFREWCWAHRREWPRRHGQDEWMPGRSVPASEAPRRGHRGRLPPSRSGAATARGGSLRSPARSTRDSNCPRYLETPGCRASSGTACRERARIPTTATTSSRRRPVAPTTRSASVERIDCERAARRRAKLPGTFQLASNCRETVGPETGVRGGQARIARGRLSHRKANVARRVSGKRDLSPAWDGAVPSSRSAATQSRPQVR